MQNKFNSGPQQKQTYKRRSDRLLLLQRYFTQKISETQDEKLIKYYLGQCGKIAEQRLNIEREGAR